MESASPSFCSLTHPGGASPGASPKRKEKKPRQPLTEKRICLGCHKWFQPNDYSTWEAHVCSEVPSHFDFEADWHVGAAHIESLDLYLSDDEAEWLLEHKVGFRLATKLSSRRAVSLLMKWHLLPTAGHDAWGKLPGARATQKRVEYPRRLSLCGTSEVLALVESVLREKLPAWKRRLLGDEGVPTEVPPPRELRIAPTSPSKSNAARGWTHRSSTWKPGAPGHAELIINRSGIVLTQPPQLQLVPERSPFADVPQPVCDLRTAQAIAAAAPRPDHPRDVLSPSAVAAIDCASRFHRQQYEMAVTSHSGSSTGFGVTSAGGTQLSAGATGNGSLNRELAFGSRSDTSFQFPLGFPAGFPPGSWKGPSFNASSMEGSSVGSIHTSQIFVPEASPSQFSGRSVLVEAGMAPVPWPYQSPSRPPPTG